MTPDEFKEKMTTLANEFAEKLGISKHPHSKAMATFWALTFVHAIADSDQDIAEHMRSRVERWMRE